MSDFITYMQKKNVFLETIIRLGVPLTYFSFAGFLMTCNSYFINARTKTRHCNPVHTLPLGGGIQLVSVLEGKSKTSFIRHA